MTDERLNQLRAYGLALSKGHLSEAVDEIVHLRNLLAASDEAIHIAQQALTLIYARGKNPSSDAVIAERTLWALAAAKLSNTNLTI